MEMTTERKDTGERYIMHVALRMVLALAVLVASAASGRSPRWMMDGWDPDPQAHLPPNEIPAWRLYLDAVSRLHSGEDWQACAAAFRAVHNQYPTSRYSEDSRELGQLLSAMAAENRETASPDDWRELPTEAQITYHTRNLRALAFTFTHGYGSGPPSEDDWKRLDAKGRYCSLAELRRLGDRALVPLSELLTDRRPTRSLFYPHSSVPERRVLRYQDLAAMVLFEAVPRTLLPHVYGASFSTSRQADRQRMARCVREWCRESRGKTQLEKLWLAARLDPEVRIYELLDLMSEIAKQPGQRERVLQFLNQMWDRRHPVQRAQVSYLMCRLGDTSRLPDIARYYLGNLYGWFEQHGERLPDSPPGPSMNGREYALRQLILFGTRQQKDRFWRELHGTPRVAVVGGDDWEELVGVELVADAGDDDDDDDDPSCVRRSLRTECYDMLLDIAMAFNDDPFQMIPPETTRADYPGHWLQELRNSSVERACDIAKKAMQALRGDVPSGGIRVERY